MAQYEDLTQLAGLLKPTFSKTIPSMLPEAAICQERWKFAEEARVGDQFWQPMLLQPPQGLTPVGASPGVVSMNAAIASKTAFAKISSYENVLRDQISYGALDRAREEGKTAFANSLKFVGANLAMQLRNYNEMSLLFGQTGILSVASLASQVITISDDSWSPAIAGLLENAIIDVYQSDLSTSRQLGLVVTAVDLENKTLTVTGTTTGIVSTDVIFPKGACAGSGSFNEQLGLWGQISTTSGNVFSLSKTTYSAYRGNVFSTVGPLTPGKLLKWAARIQARGFAKGKLLAFMSPRAFAALDALSMSQRVLDDSYSASVVRNGADSLEYRFNSLVIEPVSHPFFHEGKLLMTPDNYIVRSGAKDIDMKVPGSAMEYFLPMLDSTGVQLQASSDVFIFAQRPNWSAAVSGITYAD
jgi:hypothetical protein